MYINLIILVTFSLRERYIQYKHIYIKELLPMMQLRIKSEILMTLVNSRRIDYFKVAALLFRKTECALLVIIRCSVCKRHIKLYSVKLQFTIESCLKYLGQQF